MSYKYQDLTLENGQRPIILEDGVWCMVDSKKSEGVVTYAQFSSLKWGILENSAVLFDTRINFLVMA